MPNKTSRKSPTKDENGGKLGQFTTEVAKTIAKAKEEQKKESTSLFMSEIKIMEGLHSLELRQKFSDGFIKGLKKNTVRALCVGIVIGSALTAMFFSV